MFSLIGCSKNNSSGASSTQDPISRTELFMGTVVKITLYDSIDTQVLDKAFDRVKEIEDLVSINKTGTEQDQPLFS